MNQRLTFSTVKDSVTGFIVRLIPILLLASLTLLSFWYLKKNILPELPTVARSKEHKPDYVFTEAKLTVLNLDGSTKYRLLGREFKHYEDDASIDVLKPQLRLFNKNAQPTTVRSETAHISGDLDIVELFKNVLVSRPDQINSAGLIINPFFKLNSEYLEVFINDDRLSTRLPVKIQRGESIVTATKGADYDNVSQSILMFGDVSGVIAPNNSFKR
ncbi:LPS export ABC transporter periplasmic protein LptC [Polynucleobacter kasalickyi]|uniref:Lipopolysaccharide export system protein LptC n=1 Tax=Polynucleobacter kasalickyi TaxID=1938817 RepID=A0A1W2AQK3_9BURK|nr:LPS export ABC transporter periplasmic protein LptC [Polynucleobacter kasalickyi]SMC62820.1 lipopolysaccharide export system protein LptC [Polynucleobacter kasalickyi]